MLGSTGKIKLCPELSGDFWMIGDNPDLGELQGNKDLQHCVDHHIFQSSDGMWHLWGCIRGTVPGRILYHWEAEKLTDCHWRQTGEYMRINQGAGESIHDWKGEEWMQSPFVISENCLYYMFYGGHTTGMDEVGGSTLDEGWGTPERWVCRAACQICLMTSEDGRTWTRYRDANGYSRLFIGPGEVRDPSLIKIDNLWYMYYAGCHFVKGNEGVPAVYARTSHDLIHWSGWKVVHYDLDPGFGGGRWGTESPHVVKRGGYFFLFRTEDYAARKTHVFRSEDPMDFGIGNAAVKYIGSFPVAAPEIITDTNGQEYITSNHDLAGGTQLCKLKWVPVDGQEA